MATLATLRAKLNGELGVTDDAGDIVWPLAVRNNAISDGYAELWRAGVWKPATQTIAAVTDSWTYALTSIRRLIRVEALDTSSRVIETPKAIVEDDYTGGWQLRLVSPISTGVSLRVRGWTAYASTFANDAAVDDLPAEYNRIPLLKAKAILWRSQLSNFARYGERQALPPSMNMTIDQLLAMVSASEREFADSAERLAKLRPRTGQTRTL